MRTQPLHSFWGVRLLLFARPSCTRPQQPQSAPLLSHSPPLLLHSTLPLLLSYCRLFPPSSTCSYSSSTTLAHCSRARVLSSSLLCSSPAPTVHSTAERRLCSRTRNPCVPERNCALERETGPERTQNAKATPKKPERVFFSI